MTARSHTRLKRKRRRRLRPRQEVALDDDRRPPPLTEGYRMWQADERRLAELRAQR